MNTFYHKIDYWRRAPNREGCVLIKNRIVGCPCDSIDDAARHRNKIAKEYGGSLVAISTHGPVRIDAK